MEPEIKENNNRDIILGNNAENLNNNTNNDNEAEIIPEEVPFCTKYRYIIFTTFKCSFGILFLFSNYFNELVTKEPGDGFFCIYDWTHIATANINKYLLNNLTTMYILIVSSTILIYFLLFYVFIHWIIKGKSWRFPFALMIYFILRFIVQWSIRMMNPNGGIDKDLQTISPFVFLFSNTTKFNDYFFSFSVGLPILCAQEFFKEKNYVLFGLCFLSSLFELLIMVFTRGNYIIDLVSGIVFAHYVYMLVDEYIHYLDNGALSLDPDGKSEALEDKKE